MFAALACKGGGDGDPNGLKTDLADNETVKATFESYKNNSVHCAFVEGRKRAIISGFALFGEPFNISGIAAMSMAKDNFWPASAKLDGAAPEDNLANFARHSELATTNGGYVKQRTLAIDGTSYEVCFLYLDVKWDLAAAIILHEASLFRPDLVVMSGMNGGEATKTFWESGALNNATNYAGFDQTGEQNANNVPVDQQARILEDLPFNNKLNLTWNASGLSQANAALIAAIRTDGPYGTTVGQARTSNNYICNNVSFAVTAGLTGRTVKLAGELITIEGANYGTKTGFLHYPYRASATGAADNGSHLYGWNKVLANTIKFSLGN